VYKSVAVAVAVKGEVNVPACAVAIHVVGRSKCASLCCCFSCLWFEVSVSVCSVAIDVKSSK
jgi:hypothetical protein